MASDFNSEKGIDQELLELGQSGDCEEDETEFQV